MEYKWFSPHDWLLDKISRVDKTGELLDLIKPLIYKIDGDTIQDMYQTEMGNDGYFDSLNPTMQLPEISKKELVTIMAALRIYQDISYLEPKYQECLDDLEPLTNKEVDDLCEKLNMESTKI